MIDIDGEVRLFPFVFEREETEEIDETTTRRQEKGERGDDASNDTRVREDDR